MSYSVSVAVRDVSTKERLLEFLRGTYRPWYDVLGEEEEGSQFVGPASVKDKPTHIGFGYNSYIGPERSYNYAVIRWMAIRAGRRRRKFQEGVFNTAVPYYTLWSTKGSLAFPVIVEGAVQVPQAYEDFTVDEFGLLKGDRTARELAWRNIPEGTFERVSMTHMGKSPQSIREALVRSGIERAKVVLQFVRAEISRLDVLWND